LPGGKLKTKFLANRVILADSEMGKVHMKKDYQAPVLTKRAALAQVAATVKAITLFRPEVKPL
jgi:hypothetical protein